MRHPTTDDFEQGIEGIRRSPTEQGTVDLVVCRPAENQREVLAYGLLDVDRGLVGDMWQRRPSTSTHDGSPNEHRQLTLMNARAAALIAGTRDRWPLAGDQLYVDLDLSVENLPAWTRLQVGGAVIEITSEPHTGCVKFAERFGRDALRFVNSSTGRALRLRGANAHVVMPGPVRVGDAITKVRG